MYDVQFSKFLPSQSFTVLSGALLQSVPSFALHIVLLL
jgi:hypothetical protein